MTIKEKVRENLMRRAASRQGYRLVKIRRRDHRAIDYGKFLLIPNKIKGQRKSEKDLLSIDQVETRLFS